MGQGSVPRFRVLVIYAADSWPLRTAVEDHLFAFQRNGPFEAVYVNILARTLPTWLLRLEFDLIVFHTIFLARRWQPEVFRRLVRRLLPINQLRAPRMAIPQDEFLHTDLLCDFLTEFRVEFVLSCAEPEDREKIYATLDPRPQMATILTGYLEPATVRHIDRLGREGTGTRTIDIGYRAWRAQPWLGRHGMLKTEIAQRVLQSAPSLGLRSDISLDVEDTLLGDDWLRFLLDCRYTVGVEGGASILDRDGSVKRCVEEYLQTNPDAPFEEVEALCFPGRDGELDLFALSPRHLEACATRTGQILVEGAYGGVLRPHEHYIPVRPDFSNLPEALELAMSEDLRRAMTDRAYADVVASGRYLYGGFVQEALALSGAAMSMARSQRRARSSDTLLLAVARASDLPSRVMLVVRRMAIRALRAVGLFGPARGVWKRLTNRLASEL